MKKLSDILEHHIPCWDDLTEEQQDDVLTEIKKYQTIDFSDEEVRKAALNFAIETSSQYSAHEAYISAIKWYKEQIEKQKS